jgi:hypothetical protein
MLMHEVLMRLEPAIEYSSNTVRGNNVLFNGILETVAREVGAAALDEIVRKMPSGVNPLVRWQSSSGRRSSSRCGTRRRTSSSARPR